MLRANPRKSDKWQMHGLLALVKSLWLVVLVMFYPQSQALAAGDTRMALILGLGDYKISPLPNAINDAESVGKALKKVGFDVTYVMDLDRVSMLGALDSFSEQLRETRPDWLVVYYAGHAMQYADRNYLLPIDVEHLIKKPQDLKWHALELNDFIENWLSYTTETTFLLLDACRDPGLFKHDQQGLSTTLSEIQNLNIAYFFATQANNFTYDGQASNSPFAQSIVENITVKGQSWPQFTEEVINRTEELTSNYSLGKQTPTPIIKGRNRSNFFYFVPELESGAVEECGRAWNSIVIESNFTKGSCRSFQRNYPHCTSYREQARSCQPTNQVSASELYKDCKRYYRGSGGLKKDPHKGFAKCNEAVTVYQHKEAAFYIASKHFKREMCGSQAKKYLQIAASQGHKKAKLTMKKCLYNESTDG